VNIFFSDQWDFNNATLFQKHSLWEMFRWQHGPHRLGLGALLSKLAEPHFRWNSRAEAFLATAIITVAALCALYLKTRLCGSLNTFDIAIPVIFFTPTQYESLWVTPDFAHGPLPLLLMLLYCLALTCERAVTRYVLVLVINFVAIYTGFGLLIGLVTPVWLIFEYYSKRVADRSVGFVFVPLVVSLVSLGSFFVGYRFDPAAACFSPLPHSPMEYFAFVDLMLGHFLGARHTHSIAAFILGGIALGVMITVVAAFGKRFVGLKSYALRDLVPALLAGYCLLFCIFSAYGRACLGPINAFASRYTEYVALGFFGVYLYTLGGGQTQRVLLKLLLAMLLLGSVWTREDRSSMEYAHDVKARWRSCYLRTEQIPECDRESGLWIHPAPEPTHLKEKLEYLKQTKQNLYSGLP
jgi:hypothetical protein